MTENNSLYKRMQPLTFFTFQVTPEDSQLKPMEVVSTIKVLDEPITTVYKKIDNTKSSSFLKWSNLADEISKLLSVDTEKVNNFKKL